MRRRYQRRGIVAIAWFAAATPAMACQYPDQGTMPLRRAVTRVELLPETDAWAREMRKSGVVVQYAVLLEETLRQAGRCYWTVEVLAEGKLWRRFFVTPDGKSVLSKE
jgi:hypothetical protein